MTSPDEPRRAIKVMSDGRAVDLLALTPEDVRWPTVARELSRICRFGGSAARHYSVAEHSLLVASAVPPAVRAIALLHDAHEAFIGDILTPTARALGAGAEDAIHRLKWTVDAVIARKAGIRPDVFGAACDTAVRDADTAALVLEARALLPDFDPAHWPETPAAHKTLFWPMSDLVEPAAMAGRWLAELEDALTCWK